MTRRSGSSIKGKFLARSGNKRLKNALFYSAFAAIHCHPASRVYYVKNARRVKHNAAVIYLARRRCNVIYAMLKRGEFSPAKSRPSRSLSPLEPACAAA